MTIAELVLVLIFFVIGYALGVIYPVWQPEDEIEDAPIIEEIPK